MHDDRAYTLAMAGYALSELRRQDIFNKRKKSPEDLLSKLPVKKAKRIHGI